MYIVNCEIYLILTCSSTSAISEMNGASTFTITDDRKVMQNCLNKNLFFKGTINWDKYQLQVTTQH